MTSLIVGPPASGETFYDRKNELELIWKKIERGHLLLAAPRRFGKTSIFIRMKDFPKPDNSVHFVDLQGFGTPEDFAVEITAKLIKDVNIKEQILSHLKKAPSKLLNIIRDNIDEAGVAEFKVKLRENMNKDWKYLANGLFAAAQKIGKRTIIILDELPLLIRRMAIRDGEQETELFLYWLREMRLSEEFRNIRFIMGGSIGIEHILSRVGCVAAINDLEKIQIGGFAPEIAMDFLGELCEDQNLNCSDEGLQKILDIVDIHIPYFLQIMVSALSQEAMNKKLKLITPQVVEDVYNNRVLGVECRTYFEHYHQRLSDYYSGPELRAASEILKRISIAGEMETNAIYTIFLAHAGDVVNPEETFHHLLGDLENDFYIENDPEGRVFRFKTRVLRDWWKKHYGFIA